MKKFSCKKKKKKEIRRSVFQHNFSLQKGKIVPLLKWIDFLAQLFSLGEEKTFYGIQIYCKEKG